MRFVAPHVAAGLAGAHHVVGLLTGWACFALSCTFTALQLG